MKKPRDFKPTGKKPNQKKLLKRALKGVGESLETNAQLEAQYIPVGNDMVDRIRSIKSDLNADTLEWPDGANWCHIHALGSVGAALSAILGDRDVDSSVARMHEDGFLIARTDLDVSPPTVKSWLVSTNTPISSFETPVTGFQGENFCSDQYISASRQHLAEINQRGPLINEYAQVEYAAVAETIVSLELAVDSGNVELSR